MTSAARMPKSRLRVPARAGSAAAAEGGGECAGAGNGVTGELRVPRGSGMDGSFGSGLRVAAAEGLHELHVQGERTRIEIGDDQPGLQYRVFGEQHRLIVRE